MQAEMKEKIEDIVSLIDNVMVDPDIDVEYNLPFFNTSEEELDDRHKPFILVKYAEDRSIERKIHLRDAHFSQSAQEIANYVTFSIEQFKEEVDSLKYGAQ